MTEESEKFKDLVNSSSNILITSHISPDPDAVSSLLLMGETIKANYPEKIVHMVLEDEPSDLSFLPGYKEIVFKPVNEAIREMEPDLFILLDGNNFERCSRHDGQKIREYIKSQNIPTIIIDHHEVAGKDDVSVFINNSRASTAQDVFSILFDDLGLNRPQNAAQIAMTGFYADTGGFVYVKAGQQHDIFSFAERLVSEGADIEGVKNQLESYSESDMKVLSELAANITHQDNYTYSFLTDDFINQSKLTSTEIQRPLNTFLNNYIRNIEGRKWGFIVYKNLLQGENYYSVSLRSQGGEPDVSVIALAMGGGGHKPAAGAKFEAKSLDDALNKVKEVIAQA